MDCHWKRLLPLTPAATAAWKQGALRWQTLRLLRLGTLQGLYDQRRSLPRCLSKTSSPPQQGRATPLLTQPRLNPALAGR